MSEPRCYFYVQVDTQCRKLEFCQTTGTVTLTDLEADIQKILLRIAGLLCHEGELTICFHDQQLFGNAFEGRAKYCCRVLASHQRKVQSKRHISLLMAKEVKAKGFNVIPGHSFCRQCVKNMIISWRMISMNQMLSRMNQITITLVKRQERSSIPALTLWVSPLTIYMVLLNTVRLRLQKINWTEQLNTKNIIIRCLCYEY